MAIHSEKRCNTTAIAVGAPVLKTCIWSDNPWSSFVLGTLPLLKSEYKRSVLSGLHEVITIQHDCAVIAEENPVIISGEA